MLQRSISSTATLVPEDYDVEAQIASLERKTISHNSSARTSTETLHEGEKNREEKAGPQSDEPILITSAADDRSHPMNWSTLRKTGILLAACFQTLLAGMNATHIAIINPIGAEHFGITADRFTLGFTVFMMGVAFAPLFLAPLSELMGRNVIFQVSSILVALLFIPQALSDNFIGYLIARLFQGMVASVGASMVGGSIADMYHASDRGLPMNVFTLMNFGGQALGGAVFGWVGPAVGFRWTYGVLACIATFSCALNALLFRETRSDVLLARKARSLTRETGRKHTAKTKDRQSFSTLLAASLIRPLYLLVTEPIVAVMSAWIGFAWSCVFLGGTSISLVFHEYGWSSGPIGTVQLTLLVGGLLGFFSSFHQQHVYAKIASKSPNGKAPPEARLIWAAFAGLLFPLSLFVFAWTGRPGICWVVPVISLCTAYWGVSCMFSSIFNYLADAYEGYSSSAQAAQSFVRNFTAGLFPLFARKMYLGMGYPQATSAVASVALLLSLAPIMLLKYGAVLRAKSKIASAMTI